MCLPISVCHPGLSKLVLDQLLTELCCSKSHPRRCVCLPSTARGGIWPGYTHGAKRTRGLIADYCPGSPPRLQPQRGADGDGRAPKSSRFHLSHLPIKCTVSSTTSQQPKNLLPSPRASGATWGGSGELSLRRQPPPGALAGPGHGFGGVFFGGALSGLVPYLPVHVAEHRVGVPPSGACALAAVSMVTAAPGEEQLAGCWGWQDPRLPPDPPENLTGSRCVRERRSRTKRGGKARRENSAPAGYRGLPPNSVRLRTGFRKGWKGWRNKKKKKRMMRKLQFWCGREGDICCSISGRRIGDLNTWKFKLLPEPD